jgi:hypothetical protein
MCRENKHWNMSQSFVFLDFSARLDPTHSGHLKIENDEIRAQLLRAAHSSAAIRTGDRSVACPLEELLELQRLHRRIVGKDDQWYRRLRDATRS